jgi:NADH:ubiquinone reductase (H+-translocating)
LIVALGTIKDDRKVKGAAEYAIPLKTLEDGKRIHNRIVESLEKAAALERSAERDAYLTFVVIGGSTGAELAGSIVDYVKDVSKLYPHINFREDCKIYVIEAGERLFPGGNPGLSDVVKQSLEDRGADVLLGTRVEQIDHSRVSLSNGSTIRSFNVFDNSGVRPNPVLDTIPDDLVKKEKGKILVDEYLRVPGFENVLAIGDNSSVKIGRKEDGAPRHAPPTAESAVEEGKYAGTLIASELNQRLALKSGRSLRVRPFRYKEKGTMISIGSHTGVAKFPNFTFTGSVGWIIWRMVHLYLISTIRSKVIVSFEWILDLFIGKINTAETP